MPAALIIGPHLSISDASSAPSPSGVELSTTTPSGSNRALTAGSDNAVTVAAFSLAMISGGVLAGTNSAYQDDTSNPGTPDSAMVGSSGAVGKRFGVVTASPRSCPERTVCKSEPVVLIAIFEHFPSGDDPDGCAIRPAKGKLAFRKSRAGTHLRFGESNTDFLAGRRAARANSCRQETVGQQR